MLLASFALAVYTIAFIGSCPNSDNTTRNSQVLRVLRNRVRQNLLGREC